MNQRNQQYTCLSVDQLRKTQNHNSSSAINSISSFFNIKFDFSQPLRLSMVNQNQLPYIRQISKTTSRDRDRLFQILNNQAQKRFYYSSDHSNKKLNTHKKLQSITKIIERKQLVKIHSKEVINRKKTNALTQSSFISPLKLSLKRETSQRQLLPKRFVFQQMLKKCDKLKEISKFQTELINVRSLKKDKKVGIRFNIEPLEEYQKKYKPKIFLSDAKQTREFKKLNKSKFKNGQAYIMERNPEEKSLDIRKYKNQSVIGQRQKYNIKKGWIKHRRQAYQSENRDMQRMRYQGVEKNSMSPWEHQSEYLDFQYKRYI